jgi:hypothetical protein
MHESEFFVASTRKAENKRCQVEVTSSLLTLVLLSQNT